MNISIQSLILADIITIDSPEYEQNVTLLVKVKGFSLATIP